MSKKLNAVTIWVVHQEAMNRGCNPQVEYERLVRIFTNGENVGMQKEDNVNPVEINIRPTDSAKAFEKWVKVTGDPKRVLIISHHKPAYDKFNEVFC